jgi:hypothetical protein
MLGFQIIMFAATVMSIIAQLCGGPDTVVTEKNQRLVWALQLMYLLVSLFLIGLVIKIQH